MNKIRAQRNSSLHELFERVQHVRYVVLTPYRHLPMDAAPSLPTTILTDQFSTINSLWNLTRFAPENIFSADLGYEKRFLVTVLEKGKNVFPEQFESDLLARATFHESVVRVPDSEHLPWIKLYWKLVYEKLLADQPGDREVLLNFVFRRTGSPIASRYRWLPFCCKPIVPAS